MGRLSPVPVREVPCVATLVPQGGLEGVNEVSVPVEEVAGLVDGHGLVDVGGDKVIVSRSYAWRSR